MGLPVLMLPDSDGFRIHFAYRPLKSRVVSRSFLSCATQPSDGTALLRRMKLRAGPYVCAVRLLGEVIQGMSKFLVLYRGGDASQLSPAKHKALMEKWGQYMHKLGASGALKGGAPVQSSAATQIVGKAKTIKAKRAGNSTSYVGGYCVLEGKNMKAIQSLSKTCPHVTLMDGTIEIIPIMGMP